MQLFSSLMYSLTPNEALAQATSHQWSLQLRKKKKTPQILYVSE